jgi:hypothetical protein
MVSLNVQTIITTTTIANTIDAVFVEAEDPTVNVILPAITRDNQICRVQRNDTNSNSVFVIGTGSDTVSNAISQDVSNRQFYELVSNNSLKNWEIRINMIM